MIKFFKSHSETSKMSLLQKKVKISHFKFEIGYLFKYSKT